MNTNTLRKISLRSQAFTLIELLTVIAIIGILAAIIIPTVSWVRGSARSAQCVSGLRQINMAIKLYIQDNKGFLPSATRPPLPTETGGSNMLWTKQLGPYLPGRGGQITTGREHVIFVCPDAVFPGMVKSDIASSYLATAAIMGLVNGIPTASNRPRQLSSIDNTRQSQIPLIMEGKAHSPGANTSHHSRNWASASADMGAASPEVTAFFDFRHNGRMNVNYVDGSVRSMDFATFKTLDQATYTGVAAN